MSTLISVDSLSRNERCRVRGLSMFGKYVSEPEKKEIIGKLLKCVKLIDRYGGNTILEI